LWQFDIVLSTHGIPSYPIQTLIGLLSGTSASLFSSLRVEEGSWWLPVLQGEKECHGPALTVGEFSRVLDDLRRQILLERQGLKDWGERTSDSEQSSRPGQGSSATQQPHLRAIDLHR
jgi:hypothetical protein